MVGLGSPWPLFRRYVQRSDYVHCVLPITQQKHVKHVLPWLCSEVFAVAAILVAADQRGLQETMCMLHNLYMPGGIRARQLMKVKCARAS